MWIGHEAPISWLPCSSDLEPLGCFKEHIYAMEVKVHNNMIGHILIDTVEARHQPQELGHVRDSI
jgi:hypothetical protein